MSNLPENISPFDFARIQLMGQLSSVADSMRKCADVAEHFSQVIAHLGPNATMPPIPQFNTLPMADPKQMAPLLSAAPAPANGKRKAQTTPDGEAKKRKVKKPRDPDAPKRPASSYLLFQNEVRQAMKKANPGMANHEILTTISQRWAAMTPEEKETYNKRQEVAKAQYTLDKTAYDARRGSATEGAVSPAAAALTASSPTFAPAAPPSGLKVAKATPLPAPVVADTSTSSDDSSDEESLESSDSSNDEVEEDEPAQKKSKKAATSKMRPAPKKETKKVKN